MDDVVSESHLPPEKALDTVEPTDPLSPRQLEQLTEAHKRTKEVLVAVNLANFNFWSFAICAVLSLLVFFFYRSGLVITVCLTVLAYNELKGGRRLHNFEPKGGLLLFYNQLGCFALIALYCLWQIAVCYLNPTPFDQPAQLNSMISQALSSSGISDSDLDPRQLNQLYRSYITFFYIAIIALSGVFQGLCAWTYYRRYRLLEAFLRQTPRWILTVLKAVS
jgi:hypothetical protein